MIDGVIGGSHAQNAALWRLREGITESLARFTPYKNDIAVRVACVPEFINSVQALVAREYPDFEVVWFGHVGDGTLHISILKPDGLTSEAFQAECDRVTHILAGVLQEFGGSISAEHGVGVLKKPYLHFACSEEEIRLMTELKRVCDPAGILNPGKLLR